MHTIFEQCMHFAHLLLVLPLKFYIFNSRFSQIFPPILNKHIFIIFIGELKSHTFIGRKNLKSLYLNHSLISSVQNHTFNGLISLQVLHLEGNSIKELQGDEFHGLKALRELYLQNNLIRSVNNVTFRDLENLEILFLHGNRLLDFPVWKLSFNSHLASMRLADNTWTCECHFVQTFHDWLIKHTNRVQDSNGVACVIDPNNR